MNPLVFLKLGGSLITDKQTAGTHHPEVLARLAQEIKAAIRQKPDLRLLLGHGSGSFGHRPAEKFNTRQGVNTLDEWQGYAEVWYQARSLNSLVVDALRLAGLHPVAFPVSAAATASDGAVHTWDLKPLQAALDHGLLPLVYGDVAVDRTRGGTILSTEDIFSYLARHLKPRRILLAGDEPGVWADYPECTKLVESITPESLESLLPSLAGSAAADVTGGMRAKVEEMLDLVKELPGLEVFVFSGRQTGAVQNALRGDAQGTKLHL